MQKKTSTTTTTTTSTTTTTTSTATTITTNTAEQFLQFFLCVSKHVPNLSDLILTDIIMFKHRHPETFTECLNVFSPSIRTVIISIFKEVDSRFYDNEWNIDPMMDKIDHETSKILSKKKGSTPKNEYKLVHDKMKWSKFRSPAYEANRSKLTQIRTDSIAYFGALSLDEAQADRLKLCQDFFCLSMVDDSGNVRCVALSKYIYTYVLHNVSITANYYNYRIRLTYSTRDLTGPS
jgi:hypothetical protein